MTERQSAAAKARWKDPEKREKLLKAFARSERRGKTAANLKQRWKDPEFRKEMSAKISASRDETVRQKIGAASKARWADPEKREQIVAAIRASKKEPQPADLPAAVPPQIGRASFPLGAGMALIEMPAELTQEDFNDFEAWIQLLLQRIKRSIRD